jgi:hypothetical protein
MKHFVFKVYKIILIYIRWMNNNHRNNLILITRGFSNVLYLTDISKDTNAVQVNLK